MLERKITFLFTCLRRQNREKDKKQDSLGSVAEEMLCLAQLANIEKRSSEAKYTFIQLITLLPSKTRNISRESVL